MIRHQPFVRSVLLALLVACGDDAIEPARTQVALIPSTPSTDLDILFVIDDTDLDKQTNLKNAFPALLDELGALPDLHLGVVTSDLGTKGFDDAAPGPGIGSGPGSCSGEGKAGRLQTSGTTLVQGTFITDIAAPDGTRSTNYSTTLSAAFSAIASVGAAGCGFEQPLEAMRLALLDPSGFNADFIRPEARLAIIAMQDEDDCSFSHSTLLGADTATLGPLQSFRCTRFGITCEEGGLTPDEMNVAGEKHGCHSREDSPYLPSSERYRAFLAGYKSDARDILFATIAGNPEPVEVELRTPPGGGSAIPALRRSCSFTGPAGGEVADPAVRMAELTAAVPRGRFESVCETNLEPAVRAIAREIRSLLGDTCVPVAIPDATSCTAVDQKVDGSETPLPQCPGAATTTRDCFELVGDAACSASGVRVVTHRVSMPSADTMVSLRCTNS